jgi:uncharacterized protein (DUF2141 family)
MVQVWRLSFIGTALFWLMMALAVALLPAHAGEPVHAEAGTLTVRVENLSPKGGVLRLGLYDAARYPDDNSTPVASADVPVKAGENVVVLKDIPPGAYAIETFQDVNANGRMDTTWLGFPLEPFGFSRDARPRFSKPGFDAVEFAVAAGENEQVLHLQTSISIIGVSQEEKTAPHRVVASK